MTLTLVTLGPISAVNLQAYKSANKDSYKRPWNTLHSGHLLKCHIKVGIYFIYYFIVSQYILNNSSLATAKAAFFW